MASDNRERPLNLDISPEADRLLSHLVENGLFGTTKEQVAKELLMVKLRETVLQGWVGGVGYPDGRTQPLVQPG